MPSSVIKGFKPDVIMLKLVRFVAGGAVLFKLSTTRARFKHIDSKAALHTRPVLHRLISP